jgi:hypothetical protein
VSLAVNNVIIKPSLQVRDLGVHLDSELSMDTHTTSTCRSAFSFLRAISRHRRYMGKEHAAALIHAHVFSRLDYCASILTGITKEAEAKMQRILHYSIRLTEGLGRRDSVKDALKTRHWLPIHCRIQYRLAILVYSVLTFSVPKPLASLLVPEHKSLGQRSILT